MNPRLMGTVLVLAALAASCARQDGGRAEREALEAGVAIDPAVMAYLSIARAMHHEANLKEDSDVPGAIAALDRLTAEKRPHPEERVPEIEEVLADTYARVAELHVRQGELGKASESIREGLSHAPAASYFRGHLLEVAGIAEEARARELGDAGKVEESASAKARALDLLYQAVLVQERVVTNTLEADASSRDGGIP